MREALDNYRGTIKIAGRLLTNLRYADDTVLLAGSSEELQELLQRVQNKSEEYGLFLNVKKTNKL